MQSDWAKDTPLVFYWLVAINSLYTLKVSRELAAFIAFYRQKK